MKRLLLAALATTACSHKLEGPTPTVESVTPGLVCTEAVPPQDMITVRGDGLAALVSGTLSGDEAVRIPRVQLLRVADVMGMSITPGNPIDIPDEPGWVTWVSPTELRIKLPLPIEEGIYDVVVTNPDGQFTVLPSSLGLIPAPEISGVEPPGVCLDVADQTVTLTGIGFFFSGADGPPTVMVGDQAYPAFNPANCFSVAGDDDTRVCQQLSFTIPAGAFPLGTYEVNVQNPGGGACSTMMPATIDILPPPTIESVQPTLVCGGGAGVMTVIGTGFRDGAVVMIDGVTAATTTFVSDTQLTAVVPAGVPAGDHEVFVMNPDGCTTSSSVTVEVAGGAYVFYVDPPIVWNGIAIQVTIYATLVTGPISVVEIQPHGDPSQRMTLTSNWNAARPERVTAVVPAGLAPGGWDVIVTDGTGCEGVLENGFSIVTAATLSLTSIDPQYGAMVAETPVTIRAAGGLGATPSAYLSPSSGSSVATALRAIMFLSATRLTAVVPPGLAADTYDLIVVNPDGQVGVLPAAFHVTGDPPPIIDDITPGSVATGGTPTITITGSGFASPTATLQCENSAGTMLSPVNGTILSSSGTQLSVRFSTSSIPAGSVCLVIVTNPGGAFAKFSALAITNSSLNIEPFRAMASLLGPRRGLGAASGRPTRTARFLYAFGGDDGGSLLGTVERAAIDDFGLLGAFVADRNVMVVPRTMPGAVRIGEFIYAVGGRDGAGPTASVERARVLDPLKVPDIVDVELEPSAGIGPGTWIYRVAALWGTNDPSDPDGETLPSDPFSITVPANVSSLQVSLSWTPIVGAAGYRVYRTPSAGLGAGAERRIADVAGTTFTDDGSMSTGTTRPLPMGSLGRWHEVASLVAPREGPSVAAARHPTNASVWFLYAAGGRDSVPFDTYEVARITIDSSGAQTVEPFVLDSGASLGFATWAGEGWSVDSRIAAQIPAGTTYVYFAGGLDAGGTALQGSISGQVTSTGILTGLTSEGSIPAEHGAGAGAVAANGMLFAFGGGMGFDCGGGVLPPCIGGITATICTAAGGGCSGGPPELRSWNSLGAGGIVTPRAFMGTVLEGAFIYVLGGETTGGAVTATTEGAVW